MFLCANDDVIPLKFHHYSGIKSFNFKIRNYIRGNQIKRGSEYLIDIFLDNGWRAVSLPPDKYPDQIEALAILSDLTGESERLRRYIKIHSAYEAVIKDRNVDYSSIRHALAHPVTKLTKQSVRNSLLNRFGTLDIDLGSYHHQKEFYRCIGQMLIQIDESIYQVITNSENI
jgi:hypothetical protein